MGLKLGSKKEHFPLVLFVNTLTQSLVFSYYLFTNMFIYQYVYLPICLFTNTMLLKL